MSLNIMNSKLDTTMQIKQFPLHDHKKNSRNQIYQSSIAHKIDKIFDSAIPIQVKIKPKVIKLETQTHPKIPAFETIQHKNSNFQNQKVNKHKETEFVDLEFQIKRNSKNPDQD